MDIASSAKKLEIVMTETGLRGQGTIFPELRSPVAFLFLFFFCSRCLLQRFHFYASSEVLISNSFFQLILIVTPQRVAINTATFNQVPATSTLARVRCIEIGILRTFSSWTDDGNGDLLVICTEAGL